ncbi:hypothetical protein CEXT_674161 [Caerostris extrusa]|uniref:Uncharacterized protein n=1 Tax=Caerostris extrusa TaxID=172846 RepID=A0AAV4SXD9_CAEEX|nr:hypothetical protein CEXT_674161 [Caerostris extrusa]
MKKLRTISHHNSPPSCLIHPSEGVEIFSRGVHHFIGPSPTRVGLKLLRFHLRYLALWGRMLSVRNPLHTELCSLSGPT